MLGLNPMRPTIEKIDYIALEKLVERAIKDDRAALYELCEKIMKPVIFQTMRIIGNTADVEDVVQEILLIVCENDIICLRPPSHILMADGDRITSRAQFVPQLVA